MDLGHRSLCNPMDIDTPVGAGGWESIHPVHQQFDTDFRGRGEQELWLLSRRHLSGKAIHDESGPVQRGWHSAWPRGWRDHAVGSIFLSGPGWRSVYGERQIELRALRPITAPSPLTRPLFTRRATRGQPVQHPGNELLDLGRTCAVVVVAPFLPDLDELSTVEDLHMVRNGRFRDRQLSFESRAREFVDRGDARHDVQPDWLRQRFKDLDHRVVRENGHSLEPFTMAETRG